MPPRVESRRTTIASTAVDTGSASLVERIEHLTGEPWNQDDPRPVPNPAVVSAAERGNALSIDLWRAPGKVAVSVEGGLSLCYARGDRYADIEFTNEGEVLAVTSDRVSEPHVWSVDSSEQGMRDAIETIRGYIDGGAS